MSFNSGSIDQYKLTKTLGSGFSSKVKLATDTDGKQYAMKIFDLQKTENALDLMRQEVAVLESLSNRHIVNYVSHSESAFWIKKGGERVEVAYILEEALLGGELFDYIYEQEAMSEPMCRYFFKQILIALAYLHG